MCEGGFRGGFGEWRGLRGERGERGDFLFFLLWERDFVSSECTSWIPDRSNSREMYIHATVHHTGDKTFTKRLDPVKLCSVFQNLDHIIIYTLYPFPSPG